jgi:predicted nucleotidyltransferase
MQTMPEAHQSFLDSALPVLQSDPRIEAVVVSGSAVTGGMDAWSDLDLIVFVDDASEAAVAADHFDIAGRIGPLLCAFRGDHVGEPRLLICLYDPPLLHVDLKFMALKDAPTLHYATEVIWARAMPPQLAEAASEPSSFDIQWCADRLPGWAHYVGVKIARGELFEALNSLDFLRWRVLGPLIAVEAGSRPRAVRKLEDTKSARLKSLERTTCAYDRDAIKAAAREAFDLAWSLLDSVGIDIIRNEPAEARVTRFLQELKAR